MPCPQRVLATIQGAKLPPKFLTLLRCLPFQRPTNSNVSVRTRFMSCPSASPPPWRSGTSADTTSTSSATYLLSQTVSRKLVHGPSYHPFFYTVACGSRLSPLLASRHLRRSHLSLQSPESIRKISSSLNAADHTFAPTPFVNFAPCSTLQTKKMLPSCATLLHTALTRKSR